MEVGRKGTNLVRNELQIFNNAEFGQVRVLNKEGEPWFIGKDIAERLGYKDTSQAIRKHVDEEDKLTSCFNGSGQNREMIVINESGLYSLILSSKLPNAKKFKRWVTSEILPQIRKTGGYIPLKEQMDDEEFLARALDIAHKTLKKKDELLRVKNKEIKELKPRADYTDLILQNKALVNVNQIAQDYGMSAQKFNELLNSFRIQYKQNEQWILFAKYKNCGYVGSETFKFTHKSSKKKDVKMNTKWTQKGRKFLYDFLKEKGILPVMEREVI